MPRPNYRCFSALRRDNNCYINNICRGILNNLAQTIIFGTAGLFHGWACGNAIIGAKTAPLLSYLFGLGLTLCIIALLVSWTALKMWQVQSGQNSQPRIAAGICLGIGIPFFTEQIEGLAFGL